MDGVWITELGGGDAGRRLAVKDLFDTAGIRTTYGSAVFAEHVPTETASSVRALEEAGWTNVGKANLHEFAYGVTSQNVHYGTVPNPRAPGHTAGGSSGGSAAALVLALADAALGTDTGGSIRIPAACTGTTGFKPGYGLVPTEGVFPLAPSYDHVGPMGNDVATCVELMQTLAPTLARPTLASLDDLTIAVAWTEHAAPLVRARVEAAAALFPHHRSIDFPDASGTSDAFMREIADVHRELYAENAELYGENIRPKIERCLEITDAEATRATQVRDDYRLRAEEAFGGADLLITPTLPFVAPRADIDEIAERQWITRFTYPFNALGWPVLALPCGTAEEGLPASLQLTGPPGTDGLVLAAGLLLEAALKA